MTNKTRNKIKGANCMKGGQIKIALTEIIHHCQRTSIVKVKVVKQWQDGCKLVCKF